MIKTVYSQTLVSHVVHVSVLQPACGEIDLFCFFLGVCTAVCLTLEVCSNRYTMNSKHSYLCPGLFGFTETRFVRFCKVLR